jgi:hypothetical protein
MQLARRISLLVAFSLLTSAATAHAECAWVLWGEITAAPAYEASQYVVKAHETKPACDLALGQRIAQIQRLNKNDEVIVDELSGWVRANVRSKGHVVSVYRYVWLPDGTDPRGPKGK